MWNPYIRYPAIFITVIPTGGVLMLQDLALPKRYNARTTEY